jgi:mannitol PTS system EIIA component
MYKLQESDIILQVPGENKHQAIERVGSKLVENGRVKPEYIEGMFAREESMTTYVGNGVAIPHSMPEYVQYIVSSGVVIAQYPDGVDFGNGNVAYLVVGIAGIGEEHMEVLSQIAIVCQEQENVDKLVHAKTAREIMDVVSEGENL